MGANQKASRSGHGLKVGKTRAVRLNLTRKTRKIFKNGKVRRRGKVRFRKGAKRVAVSVRKNENGAGSKIVIRRGRVG